MNKFISAFVITAVVIMSFGCCEDAKASSEAKLSVDAVAQAGFNNLSADQQAQVLQSITAIQSKDTAMVDKVDKWVNVGERIGKMMGGAAREVGMAANEFAQTDVGRMTAMMVIWNYMGKDITSIVVHLGGGIAVMLVGFTWLFILIRRVQPLTITYDPTLKNWFGNAKRTKVTRERLQGDQQVGFMFGALVVIVLSLIVSVTY